MGNVLRLASVAALAAAAASLFCKPPRIRPPCLSVVVCDVYSNPRAKESWLPLREGSRKDGKGGAAREGGGGSGVDMEELLTAPRVRKASRAEDSKGGVSREGGGEGGGKEAAAAPHVKSEQDRIIEEARREMGVDCIQHHNLAVTGQSGVGKSSFVNAFLSLEGDACAPVGEVETSDEIRSYSCQKWPSLKLWDMPGAGTTDHPAATYFQDKKLFLFDAILVLTADRLLDVDFQILESARRFQTPCVFVRTKCDLAVASRAKRDKVNALEASRRLRAEVTKSFQEGLAKAGLMTGGSSSQSAPRLYFISNRFLQDEDAYSIYDAKSKAIDSSLSSMDEEALITFLLDAAKVRA